MSDPYKNNSNQSSSSSSDEKDHSEEFQQMLDQRRQLEIQQLQEREDAIDEELLLKKLEEHMNDARNNFNIYLTWIESYGPNLSHSDGNFYKSFSDVFSTEYRENLYANICEFFNDETMVTDDVLFYWKYMVVVLLRSSRKYRSYIDHLVFDLKTKETNLVLVKEKHIFRCFVNDKPICYFKENGCDYYVS